MKNFKYDPLVTGVFVGFGMLVLWYFSSLAVNEKVVPTNIEYLIRFVTVLAASLSGAYAAFFFNQRTIDQNKHLSNIEALKTTMFISAVKLNKLRSLYGQVFKEHENKEHRWCSAPSFNEIPDTYARVDFEKLDFLILKYDRELLKLKIAEESFESAIVSLNSRSKLHVELLQPEQEKVFNDNENVTCNNIERYLSMSVLETMKVSTDSCYQLFNLTIERYKKVQCELLEMAKLEYPDIDFLDYEKVFNELANNDF